MHRVHVGGVMVFAALALGCGGRGEPAATERARDAAVASAAPADAAPPAPVGPPPGTVPSEVPSHEALEAEGLGIVGRWVAAQNAGDHAALAALYDAEAFRGAVPRGETVDFVDAATWLKARPAKGTTVSAELVTVRSWRERGSTYGVLAVDMLERRRGADGASVGHRALQLGRGRDGTWRIVYEQRFTSEPDWTREAPSPPPALLAAPISDAEAASRWTALAPTVADYRAKLAGIPADPAIREPMARAFFAGGTLVCLDELETRSCGTVASAPAPARPSDGLDEGCLRRVIAPWAVAQLPPGEARTAALVAMVTVDRELRRLALGSIAPGDDETRLAVVAASQLTAEGELAALQLVSGDARDHAMRELGVESLWRTAAPTLAPAEALTGLGADVYTDRTTLALMARIVGDPGEPAALRALVRDGSLVVEMAAAARLAALGDTRHLPRRPRGIESFRYMHALWKLGLDRDVRRRRRVFKSFLAPDAIFREEVVGGDGPPVPGPGRPATAADADIFIDHESGGSSCQELSCPIGHGSRVRFVAVDGGLRIAELVYRRYLRTACEPPVFEVKRWPRSTKG